tara:strand:+ start:79 stop:327 length:249 start_codon:yes stop_codon:yes gene_type:complete
MAKWRTGHGVDPVGTITETNIDTWWASKDRTIEHGWDDAHGHITKVISQGIPAGHSVKHGLNDAGNKYYLTISGDNINKTWS